MPTGSVLSDQGAREQPANSEAANAGTEQGKFLAQVSDALCGDGECILSDLGARSCHSNLRGYLGRELLLLPCCVLQGGLRAGGIGQDHGKENVDPTPKPKPPRTPRKKKVSTVSVSQNRCVC